MKTKKLIPTCVKENMSNPGDLGRFFSPLGQRFNTQIHNPVDIQLNTVDSFQELRNVSFMAPLQRCTSESYYSNVTGSSDDHFYEVMGGS